MVEILQKKDAEILENNGTSRISIKGDWPKLLNMEPGDPIKMGVVKADNILHLIAVNRDHQPKIENIDEDALAELTGETR